MPSPVSGDIWWHESLTSLHVLRLFVFVQWKLLKQIPSWRNKPVKGIHFPCSETIAQCWMDAHEKNKSHRRIKFFSSEWQRIVIMILTYWGEINLLIYQFNVETNLEHMPGSHLEITAKFGMVQKRFRYQKNIKIQQFHRKSWGPSLGRSTLTLFT